jgi:hypothetical protein
MVELISAPDPVALLPPILACLPASFASPRPPPAFLPLLSPVLRQRVQFNTSDGSRDSWALLLCWDKSKAEVLKDRIEEATFEPHPVSGEIEVGDTHPITYKRFDEETLKAQIPLIDWPFTALFLWCTGSEDGDAWRLAELLPSNEELIRDPSWSSSVEEANESAKGRLVDEAMQEADRAANSRNGARLAPTTEEDDYWAMYDSTPGRTPARKESVRPTTEDEYYARYGSVQPVMDSHDPDEEVQQPESSSTRRPNGHPLQQTLSISSDLEPAIQRALYEADKPETSSPIEHPVPSSPSSRGSEAVARLEERAERLGASEVGIKQHISASMKSMYRLSRSAGISREEFERIIQRELETLSLLDLDG